MALPGITGTDRVVMALPADDPAIAAALPLICNECGEFAAALGAPVDLEIVDTDRVPDDGHIVWRFGYDNSAVVAELEWRRDDRVIVSRARDGSGLLRSLNLLHTLVRSDREVVRDEECVSVADVCERIVAEVGGSYPAFGLRGLDWAALSASHRPAVMAAAGDPLPTLQRWLAELGDAHTWVHRTPRPRNPTLGDAGPREDVVPAK